MLQCHSLSTHCISLFVGQYTNLKFQAASLGLGNEWDRICTSYAAANRALGDIVKVWGVKGSDAYLEPQKMTTPIKAVCYV